MTKKAEIKILLYNALVKGGKMPYSLYEYDMEEHIDYWYQGLIKDKDDFVFIVNENSGHVAMVLITLDKKLYINEDGRKKLQEIWPKTYDDNMKRLIPKMADDLANNIISVNGVKAMHPVEFK
ncbi:MAG: hypothetical protein Q3M30_08455 [Candidatus Electrothrix sp. Rat3]|nr:hypothetical protein [Candidatus Electrothrix rattekaaiensis]